MPRALALRKLSNGSFSIVVRRTSRLVNVLSRVEEVANKKGVKMAQIALAWSLAKDGRCPFFNHCMTRLNL